ncbi:MAG: GspE/PulE family protein [Candidatus Fermentibacteraceae bacterium]
MRWLETDQLPAVLARDGIITQASLERYKRLTAGSSEDPLVLLVKSGMIGEETLYRYAADLVGLPYKELDPLELDYETVTSSLPGKFAQAHRLVAFRRDGNILHVATCNVSGTTLDQDLKLMLGLEVQFHVSRPAEIERVIRQFYGLHSSIVAAVKQLNDDDGVDLGNLERFVNSETSQSIEPTDKPVVNAVNHLFQYAFEERASDIHLEPHRENTIVRLRIDGLLHTIYRIPKRLHLPISSRIKMIAGLNIAEKRRPQDGRIRTHFDGKPVEIRCSTVPMAFGEKTVLRILDPQILMQDMSNLGFEPDDLEKYRRMLGVPNGLILVTGPTGSGKTTTLYSSLIAISRETVNITTIEDPVEFVTDEFNQISVQSAVDLTFTSALRHILRQDPDIIMVGEIRDVETAVSAMRSALTGHLVLSTLHTNDTATTAVRLMDMGVQPYLLMSTLQGIIAQRLVRIICTECSESYSPEDSIADSIEIPRGSVLRRGAGCRACRNTGYKGRTGVYEVMEINEAVRIALAERAHVDDIRRLAVSQGMKTLRDSARLKVLAGITTPDEMLKVTLGGE